MKSEYILLNKEYDSESLYDLDRDVPEIHEFPDDAEYRKIVNEDNHGFLGGTYKVQIIYIPDIKNGDKLK